MNSLADAVEVFSKVHLYCLVVTSFSFIVFPPLLFGWQSANGIFSVTITYPASPSPA